MRLRKFQRFTVSQLRFISESKQLAQCVMNSGCNVQKMIAVPGHLRESHALKTYHYLTSWVPLGSDWWWGNHINQSINQYIYICRKQRRYPELGTGRGGWPAPLSAGGGAWGAVEQWVPWTHAPPAQPSRAAHCPRSQGCCAQRMAAPLVGAPRSSPAAGRGCHRARRQLGLPAAPYWGCWAASPRSPRSGGRRGAKSPALAIASFAPTLRDLKRRAEKKTLIIPSNCIHIGKKELA